MKNIFAMGGAGSDLRCLRSRWRNAEAAEVDKLFLRSRLSRLLVFPMVT